jgi:hypothetical protein
LPTAQRNKPPLGSRGAFDRDSQTVARIQPESFRFETMNSSPRLAGVAEDGLAIALDVPIEPDAGAGLGQR